MLSNQISQFLRDERGSYTVWSLLWFILYLGIGGLAVDMTDGYRNQTLLQATADAAALAGVMSLPDQTEAVNQALAYASDNLGSDNYGAVLIEDDVKVGTWNFDSETFTPNTAKPNAVFVVTRRAETRGNPVIMNFLRIMQLWGFEPWMDVNAAAVAVKGIHRCHNNGHIGYTTLEIQPRTNYYNDICLIGHEGVKFAGGGESKQEFQPGVYVGVGCESGCVGPADLPFSNDDFNLAFKSTGDPTTGNYLDGTLPSNAMNTDMYIGATKDLAKLGSFDTFETSLSDGNIDYSGLEFLANSDVPGGKVNYLKVPADEIVTVLAPDKLVPNTVYDVDCNGTYTLPEGTYEDVGLIFDCQLRLQGNYEIKRTLLATTDTTGRCGIETACKNNPAGPYAIDAAGPINLGSDCNSGALILSQGGVRFAASGNITGSTLLAQGNIKFAASGQGNAGIHMEATGGVHAGAGGNTESNWGLCKGMPTTGGPKVYTFSLVR